MDRTRILLWLLLGTATVAGCSNRNTPTAPSAAAVALSLTSFIGDRPYTWTLKCSGDLEDWRCADRGHRGLHKLRRGHFDQRGWHSTGGG